MADAAAKYKATLSFTITKPTGVEMCVGNVSYADLDYEDVVAMEKAVMGAIMGLADEKKAEKAGSKK